MIDLLCKFKLLCLNVDVKDNVNAIVTIFLFKTTLFTMKHLHNSHLGNRIMAIMVN